MMHPTPPPVLSQRNTNHQHPNRYFYNNNNNSNNSTENDAISLNGNSNSPLQTYPPQQSHNMPLFQNHHRRKGRAGRSMFHETDHTRDHNTAATSLVQNAMKLILLSPVLVLVIWSVTAITWTNHQMKMQQQNTGSTSYTRSSTRRQQQRKTNQSWSLLPFRNRRTVTASQQQPPPPLQQQQYILPSPQQQGTLIVQPPFLIPPSPELLTQLEPPKPGSSEDYYQDPIPIGMRLEQQEQPVVVMNPEMASAGNKNYYYSFPDQQQQQQQQQQSVKTSSIPAAATNSIAVYDPITGKTQYYYSFPEQQQGATLTDTSEHQKHLPIVMDTAPEIVPALEEPLVVPLSQQQQQPMSSLSLHGTQGSAKDNHHHFLRHDTNNNKNNHHASSNQNNIKYYFYDPKDIKNDQHHNNGNVHLPQYVYDSLGRLIPFKSLAASTFKKSPSVTMIHPNSTVLNATVYNYTHTHPPVVDTRQKRKMSFPSNPKQYLTNWTTSAMHHYNQEHGSSSQQPPMADSSIIICTVGVMALFVGALSARRMRSHQQRSILSMCIENEQLDHDAAYDTIYTTTTNPNNTIFGSNHYNTFAQGWKGDLEKFDV